MPASLMIVFGCLLLLTAGCASPAPAMQTQQLETVSGILGLYGALAGVAAMGTGMDSGH